MNDATVPTSLVRLIAQLLLAAAATLGIPPAAAAEPARPAARAPAAKAAPEACRDKQGVEREMCVQCVAEPMHKRGICEQKVFWTTCKGKRLVTDPFCAGKADPPPQGG